VGEKKDEASYGLNEEALVASRLNDLK